ncbi:hypothetical protein AU210_016298 [Fusarium oxysporum f. sp. radicis-cucumerinum]|uniref:Uncharacterized protein n=1 Tax=Fusarium oxysporum f. sp. radicis-cucumerinum TaxID=327505 RepID=A0A2H3GAB6_FUSOX|nr:hypothetical protein AU210_016298 [Fusarium oxysporum f. sp. radicis-cucumerinum]
MAAPTRLVFHQQHPDPAHVNNYTNRAVVTPQAALVYRGALQNDKSCKNLDQYHGIVTKDIPMQDFDQLSSDLLIKLALFDCETVTRTAAQFPPGVISVARREKTALSSLKKSKDKEKIDAAGEIIRENHAWIVSVFNVWMAIR